MPLPYCDIETDVKPYLGLVGTTEYDALLVIWRDSVEAAMLAYTEATFDLTPKSEVMDANRSDQIVPDEYPIASVQALYFYTETDGTGGELIDPENYYFKESAVILKTIYTPRHRSTVRLEYTYGYDGVPADVKHGILIACRAEYFRWLDKREGRDRLGRSKKDESERTGGGNNTVGWDPKTGLPFEAVNKFKPYKKFEFITQPFAQRNL